VVRDLCLSRKARLLAFGRLPLSEAGNRWREPPDLVVVASIDDGRRVGADRGDAGVGSGANRSVGRHDDGLESSGGVRSLLKNQHYGKAGYEHWMYVLGIV